MGESSLSGRRVLVVGVNYAPEHSGIAPYTTQACAHFADQGADVFVLAGVPHYPHWSTPKEYRGRLFVDEQHDQVRVRRLRHVVPSTQNAVTRGAYELTFGCHVLAHTPPWRPDVVVAVVPSLAGAAAAVRIARRAAAPLIVWVQDLMGPAAAQSGIKGGDRISAVTGRLEAYVLCRASMVWVLNESFRRYVAGLGVSGALIHVVPNWTHVARPCADRAAVRARQGWRSDEVIALHSGNMGLKQRLENVVHAARLAAAEAPHIRFVLMGDGSQRTALQELAADVPTLSFRSPVADADLSDVLAAADVLLVNERATTVDMSLPSKLTSYFRAGTPVVAAVPASGATARELQRSGAGIVVEPDHGRALVDGVIRVTADVHLARTFRKAAVQYSDDYLDAGVALSRVSALLRQAVRT
jgi:colanic acid biosynthesis glycosyl transferase WcaI